MTQLQLGQAQGFQHELDRLRRRAAWRGPTCLLGETRAPGHWRAIRSMLAARRTAIPLSDRSMTGR